MVKTFKPDYFLGVVTGFEEGTKKEEHIITADIPGVVQNVTAYPFGSIIDEPKVGDPILLLSLDPIYNSYYIYQKLKESNLIGFRASGKLVDITPDTITIGIFDPELEYKDNERPKCTSKIIIDKDNNVSIEGENLNITINSKCNINADKCNITANEVNIEGTSTLTGDVTIKGGNLTTNGTVAPNGQGPYCAIPTCPFTGAKHTGNNVSGT